MFSELAELFNSQTLLPHATCLSWRPDLLWLHAASDVLIALAYFSIPAALGYFVVRRRDLQFRWMFVLFGVFIMACGTTHLTSVWTLWVPAWGVSGLVKAITAVSSVATAALLWPMIPQALAAPSPQQWISLNEVLRREVEERRAAESQVRLLNHELEERVRRRTAELEAANQQLQRANQSLRAEIEARARVETDLRLAKAEAERANVAKSKFLAAASHDLRQPVQSMFWFFAALENRVSSRQVRSILEGMEQSLAGLKLLLDALLDASKLDAGVIEPAPAVVSLASVLASVQSEYGPLMEASGLRFRVVPSSLSVRTDPILLRRILLNFVHNALRYTQTGGVLIGCRRRGAKVRIEVVDTGPGIEADKHDAIFEEFVQIGNPERDRSKGLGLGLAIVRRLAILLGHKVGVSSTVGRGSCFFIEMDIVRPDDAARGSVPRTPALPVPERTILVIEDEALVRMGLVAMLHSWGFAVIEAESGQQAIDALGDGHGSPGLILADYRLRAGELGTDAINRVRTHCGGALPAIVVTGDTSPDRILEARASGAEILYKPVQANDLRAAIARASA